MNDTELLIYASVAITWGLLGLVAGTIIGYFSNDGEK